MHKLLANYQTGGYKFRPMIGGNGRIGWRRPWLIEVTDENSTQAWRPKSTTPINSSSQQ